MTRRAVLVMPVMAVMAFAGTFLGLRAVVPPPSIPTPPAVQVPLPAPQCDPCGVWV